MIQKSGADYAYIHFSFGPFLAFIRLWIECIILRPCIGAIQSLTFALYILKPFFPECDPPPDSVRILAAACLLVSWKVRECRPISAVKIVKYTNYSVQLETLLVSSVRQSEACMS